MRSSVGKPFPSLEMAVKWFLHARISAVSGGTGRQCDRLVQRQPLSAPRSTKSTTDCYVDRPPPRAVAQRGRSQKRPFQRCPAWRSSTPRQNFQRENPSAFVASTGPKPPCMVPLASCPRLSSPTDSASDSGNWRSPARCRHRSGYPTPWAQRVRIPLGKCQARIG